MIKSIKTVQVDDNMTVELDFDTNTFNVVSTRWKPRKERRYYYVDSDLDVIKVLWWDLVQDEDRYKYGNCFKTEREAEEARDKIIKVLKGEE